MIGAPAPDFTLRDQHGAEVSLTAHRGAPVLLVFYPWAFSRVCTGELSTLRDVRGELDAAGARLLALSCDPVFTLRAFADAEGLTYPLLSDFWPHGAVASAYGVFDRRKGCARRSSFVLDSAGLVRWAVHHEDPEARSAADYLAVIREVTGHLDAAPGGG